MEIGFDALRDSRSIARRGLSLERAAEFNFENSKPWQDARRDGTEVRVVAPGCIANRLGVVVFSQTERGIRVIRCRKANSGQGAQHGFTLACDRRRGRSGRRLVSGPDLVQSNVRTVPIA